jgi:hypothetical protein
MRHLFPAVAAALLLSGCGFVGDPLPPLVNVPSRVSGLAAVQRGSRIIVQFVVPTITTEGIAIKAPLTLDLRIGSATVEPFQPDQWAEQAVAVPPSTVANGIARYEIPTANWTGKEVTIAARTTGANGKTSNWSNFVSIPIVPPPATPQGLAAANTAQGVRLTWSGPAGDFRIFRRAGDEKNFTMVATVQQTNWTDPASEFGTQYTYFVQRTVKISDDATAESETSNEASLKPKDEFPPAAPAGLRAIGAPGSIELSWEGNQESDLAGYRIYRAAGGADFQRIAEVSQVPAYSDHAVQPGKQYRYAITAFDRTGNESARSSPVEAALP